MMEGKLSHILPTCETPNLGLVSSLTADRWCVDTDGDYFTVDGTGNNYICFHKTGGTSVYNKSDAGMFRIEKLLPAGSKVTIET